MYMPKVTLGIFKLLIDSYWVNYQLKSPNVIWMDIAFHLYSVVLKPRPGPYVYLCEPAHNLASSITIGSPQCYSSHFSSHFSPWLSELALLLWWLTSHLTLSSTEPYVQLSTYFQLSCTWMNWSYYFVFLSV